MAVEFLFHDDQSDVFSGVGTSIAMVTEKMLENNPAFAVVLKAFAKSLCEQYDYAGIRIYGIEYSAIYADGALEGGEDV